MVEGIQEMAALLQMALPPSSDLAPKPDSQGLNLAGSWEIDLPPTQGQTARTQLLRVDQVGTTVTISLVGNAKEVPIFKGKIGSDSKIVGRSSDLLGSLGGSYTDDFDDFGWWLCAISERPEDGPGRSLMFGPIDESVM